MLNEHIKERCKDLSIIILFSVLIRFITMFYSLNKNYWFLDGSSPYFLLADSWYYFSLLKDYMPNILIYFFMSIFSIGGLLIFYTLLRNKGIKRGIAVLSTSLLSLFPYFYNQTSFGYVDTNHLIFFCMVASYYLWDKMVYSIFKLNKKYFMYMGLFILNVIFFKFVWSGSGLFFMLFFYTVFGEFLLIMIDKYNKNKIFKSIALFILIAIPILVMFNINNLFAYKVLNVAEYRFPDFVLYHFLAFFLFFMMFKERDYNKYNIGLIVTYLISLLFLRVTLFSGFFAFIGLAKYMNLNKKLTKIVVILSVVVLVIMCGLFSPIHPMYDRDSERAINSIPINSSVINLWDNGHFINVMSNTYTPYRAFPTTQGVTGLKNGLFLSEDQGVSYLDDLSENETYYIFLMDADFIKLNNGLCSDNSLCYKIENNIKLKYYNLTTYGSTYILKRNEEN